MEDKETLLSTDRFSNTDFAKRYAAKHLKMSINFAKELEVKLNKINFNQGRILDSGCGPGFVIIELAKKFPSGEFIGIDLSDPLLEIANDTSKNEKLTNRVKFLKADVQNVPFPNSFFDFILNINMLHLVESPVKMLNEIQRVLKPEGLFYITDLRKSILGLIEKEMKSAFINEEAREIIAKSNLSKGSFSSDLIWWRYQNI